MQKQIVYDSIVIGAGLMGASVAAALAEKQKHVLVLDANNIHHDLGSSHGGSRVSRVGFESGAFPRMAKESLDVMRKEYPNVSITPMPTLFITQANSPAHQEFERFIHPQHLKTTTSSSSKVRTQYKLSSLPSDQIVLIDEASATFSPYELLEGLYKKIEAKGCSIVFNTPVIGWRCSTDKASVNLGDTSVSGKQLVIAAGAWTPGILKNGQGVQKRIIDNVSNAMVVERIPVFYFQYPEDMPDVIIIELAPNGSAVESGIASAEKESLELWALPETLSDGTKALKVGFYYGNKVIHDLNNVERTVTAHEKTQAISYMQKIIKQPRLLSTSVCLNARAVDRDIPLIGKIPSTSNVFMLSHTGYSARYALAFGDALSDLMQEKSSSYDMKDFSLLRVC